MGISFKTRVSKFACLFLFLLPAGCFNSEAENIPMELSLSWPTYSKQVQYAFGPGGVNHSFNIFKLKKSVAQTIDSQGLTFLNSMPSALSHPTKADRPTYDKYSPYWASFPKWRTLPIAKDDEWIRKAHSVDSGDQPTLSDFIGDAIKGHEFTDSIDKQKLDLFHQVIQSKSGYYAYGGYHDMSVIIVSPENGVAYYLFRD